MTGININNKFSRFAGLFMSTKRHKKKVHWDQ